MNHRLSPHKTRTPMLRAVLALIAFALLGIGVHAHASTTTIARAVGTDGATRTLRTTADSARQHRQARLRKPASAR